MDYFYQEFLKIADTKKEVINEDLQVMMATFSQKRFKLRFTIFDLRIIIKKRKSIKKKYLINNIFKSKKAKILNFFSVVLFYN